jgi:hypothetical protein
MPQDAATRPHGLEICLSPEALAWVTNPRPQPDESLKVRNRIRYVFGRIEDVGRLAGTDYIYQIDLELDPPLLEVKIVWKNLAFRVFGVSVGSRLCLSEVRLKKKQAYSSDQYRALHGKAKSFAEGLCLEQATEGRR